jgi:hypothetical protein
MSRRRGEGGPPSAQSIVEAGLAGFPASFFRCKVTAAPSSPRLLAIPGGKAVTGMSMTARARWQVGCCAHTLLRSIPRIITDASEASGAAGWNWLRICACRNRL